MINFKLVVTALLLGIILAVDSSDATGKQKLNNIYEDDMLSLVASSAIVHV